MNPIATERLIIRNWRAGDEDVFHRINSDPEIMRFFPFRRSRAEAVALMEELRASIDARGFGFTAVETRHEGKAVGFVGLNAVANLPTLADGAIEIGWRLVPEAWGKGYASEAAQALLAHGFDRLKLSEIVAFAVEANAPSIAVMKRIGMSADPERDFDHPRVPATHPELVRHVVYGMMASRWAESQGAA